MPLDASGLAPGAAASSPHAPEVEQLRQQAAAVLRAAAWTLLLWSGFALQRGLCLLGLPYDCDSAPAAAVFRTLTLLALAGGAAGWLAGVTAAAHFSWLASPRQAYLWLIYLATLPAYSALSNVPALRASLASADSWGMGMVAVAASGAAAAAATLAWHLRHAYRLGAADCRPTGDKGAAAVGTVASGYLSPAGPAEHDAAANLGSADSGHLVGPRHLHSGSEPVLEADSEHGPLLVSSGPTSQSSSSSSSSSSRSRGARRQSRRRAGWQALALFLLPRLPPLAYFAAWAAGMHAGGAYSLHLHHYALGWALATFGAFNHPVSGLTLATAAAILVQVGRHKGRREDACFATWFSVARRHHG